MNTLVQDLRYALRMLRHSPAFTLVAVLTLALGIGANTAIFSFVNSLFLRPLPVDQPQELVRIYGASTEGRRFDVFSYPNFLDLQHNVKAFAEAAAHQSVEVSLGTGATPENAVGELVSGTYFPMMRVRPALGRLLAPQDDVSEGGHPQIVISDGLWRRRFGTASDVVGQTLHINGHPFTIVGVAPAWFRGSYQAFGADFWAPLAMYEQVRPRGASYNNRGWGWLFATARLKPGVSVAQANEELKSVVARLRSEKLVDKDYGFELMPAQALPEEFRAAAMQGLGAFLLIVGLVLLVACANIASVVLTRVTARRREVSIRQSLGATRGRLMQQWLVESLVLASLGGAVGALAAIWLRDAIVLLVPPDLSAFAPAAPLDMSVMAFTAGLTLATGLSFGLIPAWRASRVAPIAFLKEGTSGSGTRRSKLFGTFVAAQVAVSMVLLIVSGLMLQSLRNSASFNPGFETRGLVLGRLELRRHGYNPQSSRVLMEQVLAKLQEHPGVASATFANIVPLGNDRERNGFLIPGHTPPAERGYFPIATDVIGPNYFETMRIPLLLGRGFDERDGQPGAPQVVVINETMAKLYWPGKNPIGEIIQSAGRGRTPYQIIGVARDIKYYSLGEQPRPYVYASASQQPPTNTVLHVRTKDLHAADPRIIQQTLAQVAPGVAMTQAMTFEEMRRIPLFPQRALAAVTALFGLLAMLLTAIGIYGIVSYTVNMRTRELGVRVALGAEPRDIYRLVFGRELVIMGIGVALGIAAAAAASRALSQMLFGIAPFDLATYAAVGALLMLIGSAACWMPARRAAKVDPVVALRYE